MISVAICDDEIMIGSMIERILLENQRNYEFQLDIDVYQSGEELLKSLKINPELLYDVIFMDVELKQINGIETGKFIRTELNNDITKIIFISGQDNYYREMIDVQPIGFIHKPLKEKDIIDKFELAIKLLRKMPVVFEYQINHNYYKIDIKDIIYFVSDGRKVSMYTTNKDIISFYQRLTHIEMELSRHQFFICHKSYLVNNMHIRRVQSKELIMSNHDIVPIGRDKREYVMSNLVKYRKG